MYTQQETKIKKLLESVEPTNNSNGLMTDSSPQLAYTTYLYVSASPRVPPNTIHGPSVAKTSDAGPEQQGLFTPVSA
jgi:hypothetical protein